MKDWDSLPVLATIIPGNPSMVPAGRNAWFDEMNVQIKALAREQGVTVADLNADFKASGNLPGLFADDVHPNDAGYQVIAQGWWKAITRARSATASSSCSPLRLRPPIGPLCCPTARRQVCRPARTHPTSLS